MIDIFIYLYYIFQFSRSAYFMKNYEDSIVRGVSNENIQNSSLEKKMELLLVTNVEEQQQQTVLDLVKISSSEQQSQLNKPYEISNSIWYSGSEENTVDFSNIVGDKRTSLLINITQAQVIKQKITLI